MHYSSIFTISLALSAGALAFPPDQPSSHPLPKRDDLGVISNYGPNDCNSGATPSFIVTEVRPEYGGYSPCMKINANKGDHIGVHWGDGPSVQGLMFATDLVCWTYGATLRRNETAPGSKEGRSDDCYLVEAEQETFSINFVQWRCGLGQASSYWLDGCG